MIDYDCYRKLCTMEDIASHYVSGKDHRDTLQKMREAIADKTYRVAFVGEFNRGKSSLINALLGADVLPMDILPMTATVIRVQYGKERRIRICFRDGHVEFGSVEKLNQFATKQDETTARTAAAIQEVIVEFPSVLCSNHIQILDTPGMNESESMSLRTREVLGDIDAAVIVISAALPLSQTEQNLIMEMVEQPGIRHLVFAVTYLDVFKDNDSKEKIIDCISKRISAVLDEANARFAGNEELLEKSKRILTNPNLFGLSALEAREAFHKDDEELLQQSRLPVFKEGLMSLLMRAQEEDLPIKTLEYVIWMIDQLPEWRRCEEVALHCDTKLYRLETIIKEMERELESKYLSAHMKMRLSWKKISLVNKFTSALSIMSFENSDKDVLLICDAVSALLKNARDECTKDMDDFRMSLYQKMCSFMREHEHMILRLRIDAGLDTPSLKDRITKFEENNAFPKYSWQSDPIAIDKDFKELNILPSILKAVESSVDSFNLQLFAHIEAWKEMIFEQLEEDIKKRSYEYNEQTAKMQIQSKLDALPFLYQEHLNMLQSMQDELDPHAGEHREKEVHNEAIKPVSHMIKPLQHYTTEEFIEILFKRYGKLPAVYFNGHGDKAQRKINDAIKAYAPVVSARDVLFVYDSTIFGSADEGFLMTDGTIYIKNLDGSSVFVMYSDIKKIITKRKPTGRLYINSDDEHGIRIDTCNSYYKKEQGMQQLIDLIIDTMRGRFGFTLECQIYYV